MTVSQKWKFQQDKLPEHLMWQAKAYTRTWDFKKLFALMKSLEGTAYAVREYEMPGKKNALFDCCGEVDFAEILKETQYQDIRLYKMLGAYWLGKGINPNKTARIYFNNLGDEISHHEYKRLIWEKVSGCSKMEMTPRAYLEYKRDLLLVEAGIKDDFERLADVPERDQKVAMRRIRFYRKAYFMDRFCQWLGEAERCYMDNSPHLRELLENSHRHERAMPPSVLDTLHKETKSGNFFAALTLINLNDLRGVRAHLMSPGDKKDPLFDVCHGKWIFIKNDHREYWTITREAAMPLLGLYLGAGLSLLKRADIILKGPERQEIDVLPTGEDVLGISVESKNFSDYMVYLKDWALQQSLRTEGYKEWRKKMPWEVQKECMRADILVRKAYNFTQFVSFVNALTGVEKEAAAPKSAWVAANKGLTGGKKGVPSYSK
ncbi:MAG: hypothetical protein LBU87_00530 [Lactobacillales bacterium]|jgi:hypothetical protein|nr:hypothetical protein [Lactobacillales bacterium]